MISNKVEGHSKIHLTLKQINILKSVFIKIHKMTILVKFLQKMNFLFKKISKFFCQIYEKKELFKQK